MAGATQAPFVGTTFPKKTVYHSQLVKVGAIDIILDSRPMESTYKDRLKYLSFRVAGDPQPEYQLNVERALEDVFASLPLGTVMRIQAFGREEDATIEVEGAPVGGAPAAPRAAAPAPAAAAAPRQNGNGNGNGASYTDHRPPSLARHYYEALETAHDVATAYIGKHGGLYGTITAGERLQFVQNIAASLYIEQNRCSGARPLTAVKE